jgi:WD40 repeat protein
MPRSTCPRLSELLVRWEEARARGQALEPEALCADCPDLLEPLRREISVLLTPPLPEMTLPSAPMTTHLAVPGYEVLGELGRGGMGVVYKARHLALDRVVALKMIRHAHAATEEERERFRREAEAVARLSHPNLVQIFHVGEHDGCPFFTLEYVQGGSLDTTLRDGPLPADQAAALTGLLARAVHHAHEQGVVHRDLKPANVLLQIQKQPVPATDLTEHSLSLRTPVATETLAVVVPKVGDFGLAKRLDLTAQTQSGMILGTPTYMAPEQARGEGLAVGPAADVYSLGVILYELLTGRPPFRGATMLETLDQLCRQEPVPPSRLQPKVPRDLNTICLKCLEKDSRRRYGSARLLADDLRRFRECRPIQARPAGWWERARKWARRRPAIAGLSAALVLVVLVALGVLGWLWQQAEAAHDLADDRARKEQRAREDAENHLYLRNVVQADQRWRSGDVPGTETLLQQCPVRLRESWEWRFLWRRARAAEDLPPVRVPGRLRCVAYSPDGMRIALGTSDGTVRIQQRRTGRLVRTLRLPSGGVNSLAFSPDSKWLAAADMPDFLARPPTAGTVIVWDRDGTRQRHALAGHSAVAFSPDSTLLASAGPNRSAALWEVATGRRVHLLSGHAEEVSCLAFSGRGECLASADQGGVIKLWTPATGQPFADPANGRRTPDLRGHVGSIHGLTFVPGRFALLSAGGDQTVRGWILPEGRAAMRLSGHRGQVRGLAVHPSKPWVASAGFDRTVRLWDWSNGQGLAVFPGHRAAVEGLAFDPDGRHLASAGWDGTLRLWDLDGAPGAVTLAGNPAAARRQLQGLAFSRDGKQLAAAAETGPVWLWDVATRTKRTVLTHTKPIFRIAFSADAKRLVAVDLSGTVLVWDSGDGQVRTQPRQRPDSMAAALCADGRLFARGEQDGTVSVWDVEKAETACTLSADFRHVTALAFSPDGRRLAAGGMLTGGQKCGICIWEARAGGAVAHVVRGLPVPLISLTFSPSGARIVSGDFQGSVQVWDARAEKGADCLLRSLPGHGGPVWGLAFTPSGDRLVSAGGDGTLRLWQPVTGEQLLEIPAHAGGAYRVVFSPGGAVLASCGVDGFVRLWDSRPLP